MNRTRFAFLALLSASVVALADRTDVLKASTVTVQRAELSVLPDGGCYLEVFGRVVSKADGGTIDLVSRTAPGQATCTAVFATGRAALIADQGL